MECRYLFVLSFNSAKFEVFGITCNSMKVFLFSILSEFFFVLVLFVDTCSN